MLWGRLRHRIPLWIMVITLAAMTTVSAGKAQPPADTQAYLRLLTVRLDGWDARTYAPSKKELMPSLARELDWRVSVKPLGYENDKWRAATLMAWQERLPSVLTPMRRLSAGARSLLVELYRGNLDILVRMQRPAEVDGSRILDVALFPVLSTAQEYALSISATDIGVQSVMEGLVRHWTSIWPLCRVPREPSPSPTRS